MIQMERVRVMIILASVDSGDDSTGSSFLRALTCDSEKRKDDDVHWMMVIRILKTLMVDLILNYDCYDDDCCYCHDDDCDDALRRIPMIQGFVQVMISSNQSMLVRSQTLIPS